MSRTIKLLIVLAAIALLWKVVSASASGPAEIEYDPIE